jgi:hypothetical protein
MKLPEDDAQVDCQQHTTPENKSSYLLCGAKSLAQAPSARLDPLKR